MATLLAVAVPVLLTVFATHAWAGQRVALVIGNGSYAHAPSLANPLNDTTDIGAALDRLGFKVTRIDNGSRAELWDGLQKFSFAASASEMAVVFYAGHGIEVDKRNFLVPVDARLLSDADVEFEAVPMWSSRRCRWICSPARWPCPAHPRATRTHPALGLVAAPGTIRSRNPQAPVSPQRGLD